MSEDSGSRYKSLSFLAQILFKLLQKTIGGRSQIDPPLPHLGLKLCSSNFANKPFNIPNIQLQSDSEVWVPSEDLSYLVQILLELSQKNDRGEESNWNPPPPSRLPI